MGKNMKNCATMISTHDLFCSFSLKSFFFFPNDLRFHEAAAHVSSAAVIRGMEKHVDIFKGTSITELQEKERFTMY